MAHIGIDVHKVDSQIWILAERGEIVERRIRTQRERFAAVLWERATARILIEASTESEWVASRSTNGTCRGTRATPASPRSSTGFARPGAKRALERGRIHGVGKIA